MNFTEKQKKESIARRLYDNGIPLSVRGGRPDRVVRMRQVGEPGDSRVFDLGNTATGFILSANIYVVGSNVKFEYICLEVPWLDYSIDLIDDPLEIPAGYRNYRFCGRDLHEIDRAKVLNHQLIRPQLFRRGSALQGLLLWRGLGEIPDVFVHDGVLPAKVVIGDQFEEEYAFEFNLRIDRHNKLSPAKSVKNSRTPLFPKQAMVSRKNSELSRCLAMGRLPVPDRGLALNAKRRILGPRPLHRAPGP